MILASSVARFKERQGQALPLQLNQRLSFGIFMVSHTFIKVQRCKCIFLQCDQDIPLVTWFAQSQSAWIARTTWRWAFPDFK
jgi:hypothetical protein